MVDDRSRFSYVGSVFHARSAETEKAVSPIRRRVGGTTRSPDDEARSADLADASATDLCCSGDALCRYHYYSNLFYVRYDMIREAILTCAQKPKR